MQNAVIFQTFQFRNKHLWEYCITYSNVKLSEWPPNRLEPTVYQVTEYTG